MIVIIGIRSLSNSRMMMQPAIADDCLDREWAVDTGAALRLGNAAFRHQQTLQHRDLLLLHTHQLYPGRVAQ